MDTTSTYNFTCIFVILFDENVRLETCLPLFDRATASLTPFHASHWSIFLSPFQHVIRLCFLQLGPHDHWVTECCGLCSIVVEMHNWNMELVASSHHHAVGKSFLIQFVCREIVS